MSLGAIPHSGNFCSGLCREGCPHTDCWQCAKVRADNADKRAAESVMRLSTAVEKAGASRSLLASSTNAGGSANQRTTITRGLLEGLCEKAGIRMDWNNGNPIFYDDGIHDLDRRYTKAERELMEDKIKELERIADQQQKGTLTARAAKSMAESAANQIDTMGSDVIKQKVDETLRDDAEKAEKAAIEKLKQGGASEEDIEATRTLLDWKPPQAQQLIDITDVVQKAQGSADDYNSWVAGLDKELATIAGLNDLLAGAPPQIIQVQTSALSADDIQRTIDRMKNAPITVGGYIVHPSLVERIFRGKKVE